MIKNYFLNKSNFWKINIIFILIFIILLLFNLQETLKRDEIRKEITYEIVKIEKIFQKNFLNINKTIEKYIPLDGDTELTITPVFDSISLKLEKKFKKEGLKVKTNFIKFKNIGIIKYEFELNLKKFNEPQKFTYWAYRTNKKNSSENLWGNENIRLGRQELYPEDLWGNQKTFSIQDPSNLDFPKSTEVYLNYYTIKIFCV